MARDYNSEMDASIDAVEKRKGKKRKRMKVKDGAASKKLTKKKGPNFQNLGDTIKKVKNRKYEHSNY